MGMLQRRQQQFGCSFEEYGKSKDLKIVFGRDSVAMDVISCFGDV